MEDIAKRILSNMEVSSSFLKYILDKFKISDSDKRLLRRVSDSRYSLGPYNIGISKCNLARMDAEEIFKKLRQEDYIIDSFQGYIENKKFRKYHENILRLCDEVSYLVLKMSSQIEQKVQITDDNGYSLCNYCNKSGTFDRCTRITRTRGYPDCSVRNVYGYGRYDKYKKMYKPRGCGCSGSCGPPLLYDEVKKIYKCQGACGIDISYSKSDMVVDFDDYGYFHHILIRLMKWAIPALFNEDQLHQDNLWEQLDDDKKELTQNGFPFLTFILPHSNKLNPSIPE